MKNTGTAIKHNSGGRRRLLGACLALFVVAVVVPGCGIFDTREPTPPEPLSSNKVSFIPPNDPSGVFANLKSGIENLDGENYNRSLSESFSFVPLVDDMLDSPPGTFDNWDKTTEESVINFMVSGPDTIDFDYDAAVLQDQTDWVQFRVDYDLRVVTNDPPDERVYRGVAEFEMRRISGQWKLDLLKDIERVEGYTSWGYRKGEIRGQIDS